MRILIAIILTLLLANQTFLLASGNNSLPADDGKRNVPIKFVEEGQPDVHGWIEFLVNAEDPCEPFDFYAIVFADFDGDGDVNRGPDAEGEEWYILGIVTTELCLEEEDDRFFMSGCTSDENGTVCTEITFLEASPSVNQVEININYTTLEGSITGSIGYGWPSES